jgi:hypothetical protein
MAARLAVAMDVQNKTSSVVARTQNTNQGRRNTTRKRISLNLKPEMAAVASA